MSDLTLTQLQARLATGVWSIASVVIGDSFYSGGGSTDFDVARSRHLVSALAVALGYGGYWVMVWITRRRAGTVRAVDERDVHVVVRAGQSALIAVLVSVYVVTIGLWIVYEDAGSVPVGWMWFLAYGTIILAFLAYAISTIVVDGWTRGRE